MGNCEEGLARFHLHQASLHVAHALWLRVAEELRKIRKKRTAEEPLSRFGEEPKCGNNDGRGEMPLRVNLMVCKSTLQSTLYFAHIHTRDVGYLDCTGEKKK